MIVGLISDTHGLLRPQTLAHLKGSELIIHAGDVGKADILDTLRSIAPVMAVRGNVDKDSPLCSLPESAVVQAGSKTIYVLHNSGELDLDPAAAGFDLVVFGHSHKQELYKKAGVLYVNPGSAGPRRFRLPISIALLDASSEPVKVDFIPIQDARTN